MAREAGFDRWDDLPRLRECLRPDLPLGLGLAAFPATILESEHLVFVHGGVPSLDRMEELDAWHCMKNDDYWGQGHSFAHTGKYVVVGHWPVTLYDPRIPSAAPIIDRTAHHLHRRRLRPQAGRAAQRSHHPGHQRRPGGVQGLRRPARGPGAGPAGAVGPAAEHPLE